MKSTLLVRSLTIAAMALVSACDKVAGSNSELLPSEPAKSESDVSIPVFRVISSQLRSTCPFVDPQFPYGHEPAPLPTATDSADIAIYDSNGLLVNQGSRGGPPRTDSTVRTLKITWNARDSNGNYVPTGNYFIFTRLYDSTGALLGTDSLCFGWRNSGS